MSSAFTFACPLVVGDEEKHRLYGNLVKARKTSIVYKRRPITENPSKSCPSNGMCKCWHPYKHFIWLLVHGQLKTGLDHLSPTCSAADVATCCLTLDIIKKENCGGPSTYFGYTSACPFKFHRPSSRRLSRSFAGSFGSVRDLDAKLPTLARTRTRDRQGTNRPHTAPPARLPAYKSHTGGASSSHNPPTTTKANQHDASRGPPARVGVRRGPQHGRPRGQVPRARRAG
jgi:hypothetical protein